MTKSEILTAVETLSLSDQKEVSRALTKAITETETKVYRESLKAEVCKLIDEGKVTKGVYSKPFDLLSYFYAL